MLVRPVMLALAIAVILVFSAQAQPLQDCNLTDEASLARCLKQLLLNARDKVRRESDPLHLPGSNDGEVETRDIVVRGLSAYSVPQLGVTFPQPQQISLSATISWPGIYGDLFVRWRKCKKILWKKRCISVSATPHAKVGSTSGSLTTTLTVNINDEGVLTVTPSGTRVTLNLPSVSVDANIRSGLGRWVNKILGDPASKIASRVANKWWRDNKPKVEAKARNALDKAIREDVAINLAKIGSVPEPTTTTPLIRSTTPAPVPVEEVFIRAPTSEESAAAETLEVSAAPETSELDEETLLEGSGMSEIPLVVEVEAELEDSLVQQSAAETASIPGSEVPSSVHEDSIPASPVSPVEVAVLAPEDHVARSENPETTEAGASAITPATDLVY